MIKHAESHLDHHLTEPQINYILAAFKDATGFLIQEITLPPELGTVPCALWGPAMGDAPIAGGRLWSAAQPMPPGNYCLPNVGPTGGWSNFARYVAQINETPWTGEISMQKRGTRVYESRIINAPMRPTRTVTVIAGPHDGHDCVLFTAYGGPKAPREPGDPTLESDAQKEESRAFWAVHALSKYAV